MKRTLSKLEITFWLLLMLSFGKTKWKELTFLATLDAPCLALLKRYLASGLCRIMPIKRKSYFHGRQRDYFSPGTLATPKGRPSLYLNSL